MQTEVLKKVWKCTEKQLEELKNKSLYYSNKDLFFSIIFRIFDQEKLDYQGWIKLDKTSEISYYTLRENQEETVGVELTLDEYNRDLEFLTKNHYLTMSFKQGYFVLNDIKYFYRHEFDSDPDKWVYLEREFDSLEDMEIFTMPPDFQEISQENAKLVNICRELGATL